MRRDRVEASPESRRKREKVASVGSVAQISFWGSLAPSEFHTGKEK